MWGVCEIQTCQDKLKRFLNLRKIKTPDEQMTKEMVCYSIVQDAIFMKLSILQNRSRSFPELLHSRANSKHPHLIYISLCGLPRLPSTTSSRPR